MKEHASSFHYAEIVEQQFNRGVLEELTYYDQFVVWKAVPTQGKIKKLPLSPISHTPASTTNPDTWGSIDDALKALRSGKGDGIGFVFSDADPFTGIDIDHCIAHNQLTPQACELVTTFWSYTELSPSHTGLHILVEGIIPKGVRKNGIELYDSGRYFTITTNHAKGTPDTIEPRQRELDQLYQALSPVKTQEQHFTTPYTELFVRDDLSVMEKANAAKNGEKFKSLYAGDISGFSSKSEADFTLVLLLLYWTNDDIEQAKRLFRNSGLYDEKTDRPTNGTTYLDVTIANALEKRRR